MFKKNGSSIGINYGPFNVVLKFLTYDKAAYPGFSIYVNLIMLFISILLFYFYNSIRKSAKLANQES